MGMRINTNISALSAHRSLTYTNRALADTFRRLSSGQRITQSADDAAGLAISENLRAQIRGIRQANRNANDAISLVQVAEGGLNEISNIIIRLRELAIQAASDTIGDIERKFTDQEFQELKKELSRIALSTEFSGTKLLDGTGAFMDFQIGIKNDPYVDRISFDASSSNATPEALGIAHEQVRTKVGAQTSLGQLDDALIRINSMRANLGAIQNRLTAVSNSLAISEESYSAANSRIRDADMAFESSQLAKFSILAQAGTSVLSQANQTTGLALKLLS